MGCLHDTEGTWFLGPNYLLMIASFFFFFNDCMKTPSKQCFLSILQANIY